ncbi:hypothetical protein AVEN_191978-1 [Araneus ventricosus]|uniref:Mos1 transposase HTH domain-containing protein n=1 Tax=Araneus ventricosus TaxID=182803 RepID=A0A4Y2U6M2_ARAVE|nr:hypothetical protein AVEN_191978-1 [Araneus ventricosus]
MDSSRSAQRAVIPFLRTEGEHASQIYRRMKKVYGEQCLTRCSIFRCYQRYETGRVNIKDLPSPGQVYVVTNSATISAVDELIRQNRRITTREIDVELSISKGTAHHIIHKGFVIAKFAHSGCPSICHPVVSTLNSSTPFIRAGISASVSMAIIYSCTVPHELYSEFCY